MNIIDTRRHSEVFSKEAFGYKRIDVIGAGAVGAAIAVQLAKLGLENLHVWDFDRVEAHNIANQRYSLQDIGSLKVDAVQRVIKECTGHDIFTHEHKLIGGEILGDVVFLAVDTMAARKTIWRSSLRNKLRTKIVIETRMGAHEGRVYTICPIKPAQVRRYEATLYDDAKVLTASACGATITVGATADMCASYAVWQFMRWAALQTADYAITALSPVKIEEETEDVLDNEIIFGLRPMYMLTNCFN